MVLLSGSFIILHRQPPPMENPAMLLERQAMKEQLEPLKARSRNLESALSAYRSRSPVLSGRTAGTIVYLEDGLAIVDLSSPFSRHRTPNPRSCCAYGKSA